MRPDIKNRRMAYLKVIGVVVVILVDLLREEWDGVPDEQVRDVQRQRVVDAAFTQAPVQVLVVHYRDIVIPDWYRQLLKYTAQQENLHQYVFFFVGYLTLFQNNKVENRIKQFGKEE